MPSHLILVPTDAERRVVAPRLAGLATVRIELCGFGLVAAAARTASLLGALRPRRVTLVGIAGRYGDAVPLGGAATFAEVACHGIGVGAADGFVAAGQLGWQQWPGDPPDPAVAIGDALRCDVPAAVGATARPTLVSVTAASADAADAALARARFPTAVAEDMEGFAVALACRLAAVPCTIARGISNDAGDRDHSRWRVREALDAAANLVRSIVEGER